MVPDYQTSDTETGAKRRLGFAWLMTCSPGAACMGWPDGHVDGMIVFPHDKCKDTFIFFKDSSPHQVLRMGHLAPIEELLNGFNEQP